MILLGHRVFQNASAVASLTITAVIKGAKLFLYFSFFGGEVGYGNIT